MSIEVDTHVLHWNKLAVYYQVHQAVVQYHYNDLPEDNVFPKDVPNILLLCQKTMDL